MKKYIFVFFILIAVIGGIGYSGLSSEENSQGLKGVAGPKVVISPQFYDFGKVKYGDVVKTSFKIKNEGMENLKITRVSTSCGCTKADVAKDTLAPNEETDLNVSFDPAVHKDDTDLGQLTRVVYVKSNDPEIPEAEVKIFADVFKETL